MMSEARIVDRARQGDAKAFEALFERYKQFVWNVAYRMTYNFETAEDLAQDVFVAAWKALPGFKGDAAFSTWLYRITVNKSLNLLRSRATAAHEGDEALYNHVDAEMFMRQNPEAHAGALEAERQLSKLLAKLDPDRRAVIVLREIEGLSYEQIAGATDVAVGTVRSRLARARAELTKLAAEMEMNG